MDIEQALRARVSELTPSDPAATAGEVETLLCRLADYRKRLSQRPGKGAMRELSQLRHDVAVQEFYRELARRAIRVGASPATVDEVSEHIRGLDRLIGKAQAGRLLWAEDPDVEAVTKRAGVLDAAIQEARESKARWEGWLAERRP